MIGYQTANCQVQCQTITLRGTSILISTEVTCLGLIIDSELKFALHTKRLAGRCFYQLRQLRSIRRSLNTDVTKTLVHAFISSCVDHCSSVFNGTSVVQFIFIEGESKVWNSRTH